MCCLKYEEVAYEDLVKKAPKIGAFVDTPSGKGSVINVNLLRGNTKVRLEDGFDTTLKTFTFDELSILGGKGRRAEYITARDEGRLEEAGFTPSPPPKLTKSLDLDISSPSSTHPTHPSHSKPTDRKRDDKKQNNKRRNKPPHKEKSQESAISAPQPQPQPLEGTKKKKPYYRRRKNRGNGGAR